MATLEFYYDIVSPNAYLAYKALPALQQRTGVTIEAKPCLLGGVFKATNNQSPMQAFAQVRNKMDYEMLEIKRFVQKHQLPFKMNPNFPLNSLYMMRGAVVAHKLGYQEAYMQAMFVAMWEDGRKLGDLAEIEKVLIENKLDYDAILADIAAEETKQQLIANTDKLVERGGFGLPTFFVGNEMWFGKERLRDIEEFITA